MLLEELENYADYSGLYNLLHFTQLPAFRDRIERIQFFTPGLDQDGYTADNGYDEDEEEEDPP